jgi:hypothetical protein
MRFRLAAWRPVHLLAAWCAYWLALALWALAPVLPTIWRVTRPSAHGSVSASMGDGVLRLIVTSEGATVWTGQVGLGTLALWLTLPPLLLWVFWLRAQRRPVGAASTLVDEKPVQRQLQR